MAYSVKIQITRDTRVSYENKELLDYETLDILLASKEEYHKNFTHTAEFNLIKTLLDGKIDKNAKIMFIWSPVEYNIFRGFRLSNLCDNMSITLKRGKETILSKISMGNRNTIRIPGYSSMLFQYIFALEENLGYLCVLDSDIRNTASLDSLVLVLTKNVEKL